MAGQGNYEIGYGKPPREHRFKKGVSGNPKGRPKGRRNLKTEIDDVFGKPIKLKVDGKVREVPPLKAMLYKLLEKAGTGDLKAIDRVISLINSVSGDDGDEHDHAALSAQDAAILEGYETRIRSSDAFQT